MNKFYKTVARGLIFFTVGNTIVCIHEEMPHIHIEQRCNITVNPPFTIVNSASTENLNGTKGVWAINSISNS